MVWGILTAVILGLIVWAIKATRGEAKAKERERQATVDSDLMEESENVANMEGPATSNIGTFWDRMRNGK